MGSPGGLEGILSWQQDAPMIYATLQQRRPAGSAVCRCQGQCKVSQCKGSGVQHTWNGVSGAPRTAKCHSNMLS